MGALNSPDGEGGAFPDQRVKSGGIPVRKAATAMASGAGYDIGDGAAVDGYAGAVRSGPEDADGVFGAGGKVVEVIGEKLPALEDAEVVAEPWECHSPGDAPLSGGCGVLRGAGGDGKCGDEPTVFKYAENSLTEPDGIHSKNSSRV